MSPTAAIDLLGAIWSFVFGASIGSFLHVVAHRLPQRRSFVTSRSRCPRCRLAIRPWHNVPILGWLALGGRCRDCRGAIHWRYPASELVVGLVFAAAWLRLGPTPLLVASWLWASVFLTLALLDADSGILPFELTLPALVGAVVLAGLAPRAAWVAPGEALAAAAAGAGFGLLADLGWRRVTGTSGLASGDAAFLGLLGAVLGGRGLLATVALAGIAALLTRLMRHAGAAWRRGSWRLARPSPSIPFGLYLGCAGVAMLLIDPSTKAVGG